MEDQVSESGKNDKKTTGIIAGYFDRNLLDERFSAQEIIELWVREFQNSMTVATSNDSQSQDNEHAAVVYERSRSGSDSETDFPVLTKAAVAAPATVSGEVSEEYEVAPPTSRRTRNSRRKDAQRRVAETSSSESESNIGHDTNIAASPPKRMHQLPARSDADSDDEETIIPAKRRITKKNLKQTERVAKPLSFVRTNKDSFINPTPQVEYNVLRTRKKFITTDAQGESLAWSSEDETVGSSVPSKPSQKRRRWTKSEEKLLGEGVHRYGIGNWTKILASYNFDSRTAVNLKDKWRNMTK